MGRERGNCQGLTLTALSARPLGDLGITMGELTTGKRQCTAKTAKGHPCRAAAGDTGFCFWHDPERTGERRAAQAKGGKMRHGRHLVTLGGSDPVTIRTVGDVVTLLERAVNDVLGLENSIARARCLGYLGGVIVKALEMGELEERLAEIERILGERT